MDDRIACPEFTGSYLSYDGQHRVVRIDDLNGTNGTALGSEGSGPGQFRYPAGICIDDADRIYVASAYIRDSFLEEGFSEDALAPFPLTPDPRFTPEARAPVSSTFDIVYVGSLTVAKGVPLLIDAVGRLSHTDLRLVLVGGWSSRGMRRFIGEACVRDGRIVVRPGDPLPCLRVAGMCVHPSYEEGFGYAPAEALACGVPVIVTEDTGMKELIKPGSTGVILSTGDGRALTDAIDAAYRGELLSA